MAGVGTPRMRKEALGGLIQGTERLAGGWRVGWGGVGAGTQDEEGGLSPGL